jgi:putative transposase
VIQALMTAVWKRQPKERVLVHSDQGSQYGSSDYLAFLKENNLQPSMSRRGNCHDNAVAAKCLERSLKVKRVSSH